MRHLLVTNDFPPKIGGIQSYLWELWRRLPADDVTVLTSGYPGAETWDSRQPFRIERVKEKWIIPTPRLVRRINSLAERVGAEMLILDPALPLGLATPWFDRPYMLIGHGAEFTIPHRIPVSRQLIRRTVQNAAGLIAGGSWVERDMVDAAADLGIPSISIPPGVDVARFRPLAPDLRVAAREAYGLSTDDIVVLGVSRLVPRKGFDRLIDAVERVAIHTEGSPRIKLLIAGGGREEARLRRRAESSRADVTFLGRVADSALPTLYGLADLFCMPCHDRWFGLESEGFGIVFVEAAASGVPSVAGRSGGSSEAVAHGLTGHVVPAPVNSSGIADAIGKLVEDPIRRKEMGTAARLRAENLFSYDVLAEHLQEFLNSVGKVRS